MSKVESESSKFLEELKLNYRRRVEELDVFSKHFSSASSDFRSQYLSGILDMLQYYVDLQKKFSANLPDWYDSDLMIKQSKTITETWMQTVRNLDLFYSQLVEYAVKNMRLYNQGWIQVMQSVERFYDMRTGMPQIHKNALIEIIKEAKKANDAYLKKQFPTKEKLETRKKKEVLAKKLE